MKNIEAQVPAGHFAVLQYSGWGSRALVDGDLGKPTESPAEARLRLKRAERRHKGVYLYFRPEAVPASRRSRAA